MNNTETKTPLEQFQAEKKVVDPKPIPGYDLIHEFQQKIKEFNEQHPRQENVAVIYFAVSLIGKTEEGREPSALVGGTIGRKDLMEFALAKSMDEQMEEVYMNAITDWRASKGDPHAMMAAALRKLLR